MKKPGQKGQLRSAGQKAAHRNPQLSRLRKGSVHPPPSEQDSDGVAACAPKRKPRRKLKPGQPDLTSKLTSKLSAQICGLVGLGMSWTEAAAMVGVHRNNISIWKAKGEADPRGPYGAFLKAAEKAELGREAVHLKFISEDQDWKARRWLLCNFRPDKYRMTTFSGELMGKDSTPLFSSEFSVLIELAGSKPEGERQFEVEQMGGPNDGRREIWQQSNGQKPAPENRTNG